jgi:1,4-alpha-glucan branching enzyme
MALIPVHFEYLTGLKRRFFIGARLTGGWNGQGRPSDQWTSISMTEFTAEDGCPAFRATVNLDDSQIGQAFPWGVNVDTEQTLNLWGIPTEVNDATSTERSRSFTLRSANQTERYYLTHCRRLGANKLSVDSQAQPAIHFAVWAPYAQNVEVVIGERAGGYIWADSRNPGDRGITTVYPMRQGGGDIWQTAVTPGSPLARFIDFDHQPYMFRVTKDDGSVVYRTDLYSRCQIGSGDKNPENPRSGEPPWNGTRQDLDGSKSCSVVVDPERVTELFAEVDGNGRRVWPETRWLSEEVFWQDEFNAERPVATRLADLVIYELHVHGLGLDRGVDQGALKDAMRLLDYLEDLGINAIELMPMAEFQDRLNWGYSSSHYMAIEYSGGGRDQFKHFVRACHRRGIAVILDVVYNHYTFDAERAQWAYDSNAPEHNIYYWYEGRASDWPNANGGYVDNGSSGWAPRFWDDMVRQMFISSAAALVSEFHFDGFRVDLTTAMHRDAVAHGDGRPLTNARLFGQKFLREWTQTLHLLRPNVFLIAEDHSGWSAVAQSLEQGGLGFDATWDATYYHHLIGDAQNDPSRARLLKMAGYGDDRELRMTWFAEALANSGNTRIIYHESHDEAGNSSYEEGGQRVYSGRTIAVAVNDAALIGETRRSAEARVHFAVGMTLLAPHTPMFFMGEEVGASRPYRYADFANARENFYALRQSVGANLFRFYQNLIRLRISHPALRSHNIDILHTHDANRILAFRRWQGAEELLVVGSLNNRPFADGYRIQDSRIADGQWREVLNSDAMNYGGRGLINPGLISSQGGVVTPVIPANSVVVFLRQ